MQDHSRFVNCVRFSPDGNRYASAGADGQVRHSSSSLNRFCIIILYYIYYIGSGWSKLAKKMSLQFIYLTFKSVYCLFGLKSFRFVIVVVAQLCKNYIVIRYQH